MARRIEGGHGGWEWVQALVPCLPHPAPPPPPDFGKRLGTPHSALEYGIYRFTGTKGISVGLIAPRSM